MDGRLWLWIGFWGMALGAAAIAAVSRTGEGKPSAVGVIHVFVPVTAATLYLLMALNQGAFHDGLFSAAGSVTPSDPDRMVYYGRYIDWSITTPLLLLGLSFTALGSPAKAAALVAAMLGADILMIVTGFLADVSPTGSSAKWAWYLISCGAFAAVFYVLWGPLRRMAMARSAAAGKVYGRNAAILSVLWLIYPVVFLLGSEGLSVIAVAVELAVYAIIDLLAKVAYGLLASVEHKAEL